MGDPKTVNRNLERKIKPTELPVCSKTNRNQLFHTMLQLLTRIGLCRRTLIITKVESQSERDQRRQ